MAFLDFQGLPGFYLHPFYLQPLTVSQSLLKGSSSQHDATTTILHNEKCVLIIKGSVGFPPSIAFCMKVKILHAFRITHTSSRHSSMKSSSVDHQCCGCPVNSFSRLRCRPFYCGSKLEYLEETHQAEIA